MACKMLSIIDAPTDRYPQLEKTNMMLKQMLPKQ
jgi:hypothetical protein